MTMRVAKDLKIGGMAAIDVRNLLRKRSEAFRDGWLEQELYKLSCQRKYGVFHRDCYPGRYPKEEAAARRQSARLISDLIKQGFISDPEQEQPQEKGKRWYKLTERGEDFCRATAAKPVHRKNADDAIQGLMDRVCIVNEDDRFLYRITAVVLYGSYVRGAERPADVDLAIEVERKISDGKKFHEACWKHLFDSGRACQRIGYEFDFPREEVLVFLRQRKRTLSLHSMHDFIDMKKHHNFSYQVLFGDKDKIARDLSRARTA
jgi:predicted nucleotidyltransferase